MLFEASAGDLKEAPTGAAGGRHGRRDLGLAGAVGGGGGRPEGGAWVTIPKLISAPCESAPTIVSASASGISLSVEIAPNDEQILQGAVGHPIDRAPAREGRRLV